MTENTDTTTTTIPIVATPPDGAPQKPYWLYRVAAWVAIIAGIVFTVAVIFFSGARLAHHGGRHGHHHGGHHHAMMHHGHHPRHHLPGQGGQQPPGPEQAPTSVAPSLAPHTP